jgi:hypothetical protein
LYGPGQWEPRSLFRLACDEAAVQTGQVVLFWSDPLADSDDNRLGLGYGPRVTECPEACPSMWAMVGVYPCVCLRLKMVATHHKSDLPLLESGYLMIRKTIGDHDADHVDMLKERIALQYRRCGDALKESISRRPIPLAVLQRCQTVVTSWFFPEFDTPLGLTLCPASLSVERNYQEIFEEYAGTWYLFCF